MRGNREHILKERHAGINRQSRLRMVEVRIVPHGPHDLLNPGSATFWPSHHHNVTRLHLMGKITRMKNLVSLHTHTASPHVLINILVCY